MVPDELRTYVNLSDMLMIGGRLPEAAQDALEGLAAARRLGYERSTGVVMAANAAEAFLVLGDWARAEEVLDAALRAPGGFRREALHLVGAELALGRGELELARRHLESGSRATLEPQSTAVYACLQAELALWEGRPEEAASALDGVLRSDARNDVQIREARLCALALRAETERAQLAAVRRDVTGVDEARQRAERLLDRARRSAADVGGRDTGRRGLARDRRSGAQPHRGPLQPRAVAVCHRRMGRAGAPVSRCLLPLALRGGAALGRLVANGSGDPRARGAPIASDLGARPLQSELELLARRARLDLEDHRAQAPLDQEDSLGLTPREREVLQLLARGYTNREIATELVISVKTASVHVSHILRKLDVPSRIDAARIAHRLTPPPLAAPED